MSYTPYNWKTGEVITASKLNNMGAGIDEAIETAQSSAETVRTFVGSPLKASTVSEMTDTDKIYVYVGSETGYTSGHWYYYNGSSWDDGGVYNAVAVETDNTLSIQDAPADAKAAGDAIAGIESAIHMTYLATEQSAWQNAGLSKTGQNTDRVKAVSSTTRISFSARLAASAGEKIHFVCPDGYKYKAFFSATSGPININTTYMIVDDGYDDVSAWYDVTRVITVPQGSASFFMCVAKNDDSTISPSTKPTFNIYKENIGSNVFEIEENSIISSELPERESDWQMMGLIKTGENIRASAATNRATFTYRIPVGDNTHIIAICPSGAKYRCLFFRDTGLIVSGVTMYGAMGRLDDLSSWHTDNRIVAIPNGCAAYAICCAYTDDSDFTIDNHPNVIQYMMKMPASYEELLFGNQLTGKKVSILGDSVSAYAGENPTYDSENRMFADGTYTYLGNRCRYPDSSLNVTDPNQTYWMRLINSLGMALGINESWAGSRVSWDGSTEGQDVGANKHIASQTRINHLGENGAPDIIMVNAGTNDIGHSVTVGTFDTESPMNYTAEQIANLPVDTFADAYRTMLIRLQKTYPSSMIVCLLPNYTTLYYTPTKADEYCEIIKEACDYFGVPVIDIRACGITMFNHSQYLADGIHPNRDGMNKLFSAVVNGIKKQIYLVP